MENRPRLDSWKEIATYLGRDVRTVIRWERDRGLPVYRVPGGKVSRVFAYPDELDAWLARRPAGNGENGENGEPADAGAPDLPDNGESPPATSPFARSRTAIALAAVIVVGGAAVAAWTLTREPDSPARFIVEDGALLAVGSTGESLWTFRPEDREVDTAPPHWLPAGDIDDDGRREIFASLDTRRPPSHEFGGVLARFSANGGVQWSASIADRLRFVDGEYAPPWPTADLMQYRAGNQPRLGWILHHFTWWPGLFTTFDAQGQRLSTFVNAGWIRAVVPTAGNRFLLMTGISNSRQAYFFAVLDAANPSGRSPEASGSPYECLSCPPGDPVRYVVLPRTDVSRVLPFPADAPSVTVRDAGGATINALESGGPNIATVLYELSPDLTVESARFSTSFWEWHRQLELEGKLDHRAEDCPERRGLQVQHWTRDTGWQAIPVAVR